MRCYTYRYINSFSIRLQTTKVNSVTPLSKSFSLKERVDLHRCWCNMVAYFIPLSQAVKWIRAASTTFAGSIILEHTMNIWSLNFTKNLTSEINSFLSSALSVNEVGSVVRETLKLRDKIFQQEVFNIIRIWTLSSRSYESIVGVSATDTKA